MKVRKLVLNGGPDDGERLDEFCGRLTPGESGAGARLRALAVELARREELAVTAVADEDESRDGRPQNTEPRPCQSLKLRT